MGHYIRNGHIIWFLKLVAAFNTFMKNRNTEFSKKGEIEIEMLMEQKVYMNTLYKYRRN